MNGAERLQATLAGRPVDRRAFLPVLSLYGARLTECSLDRYYSDPEAYARGQAAVRETFQPDALCAPFDFAGLAEAFGCELQTFEEAAPNIRRPAVRTASEWDDLTLPDPDEHPRLLYLRETTRRMAAAHRGEVTIVAILPPPTDIPMLVMGIEAWMETVLFDPEGTRRVIEKVTPLFLCLADRLFAEGASLIVLPSGFLSPTIVPREVVMGFSRAELVKTLARLHGPIVLHHAGAPLLAHLDLLVGFPSVVAYVLDERDDLGQARRIVGSDPVLLGGPMGPSLPSRAVCEVEETCRAVLDDRRHDPRFILCTGGPDVPWETPAENIHAMREVAESRGGFGG